MSANSKLLATARANALDKSKPEPERMYWSGFVAGMEAAARAQAAPDPAIRPVDEDEDFDEDEVNAKRERINARRALEKLRSLGADSFDAPRPVVERERSMRPARRGES